jgi:hypothetical protein
LQVIALIDELFVNVLPVPQALSTPTRTHRRLCVVLFPFVFLLLLSFSFSRSCIDGGGVVGVVDDEQLSVAHADAAASPARLLAGKQLRALCCCCCCWIDGTFRIRYLTASAQTGIDVRLIWIWNNVDFAYLNVTSGERYATVWQAVERPVRNCDALRSLTSMCMLAIFDVVVRSAMCCVLFCFLFLVFCFLFLFLFLFFFLRNMFCFRFARGRSTAH